MKAWLETERGDRFALVATCTIGRSPHNSLVLDDHEVSRRHVLIHAQGTSTHWLVDLGSRNGTLLNCKRVRQPVQLAEGDALTVGHTRFVFRTENPASSTDHGGAMETSYLTTRGMTGSSPWLLVADINQFTRLSQVLTPEELPQLVGSWFLACKEIVEKHDGAINKYLGDGFLAWWPDRKIGGDRVAGAVSDLRTLREAPGSVSFRVAVHHGQILVDRSGASGEDNLLGPDVNFVFRMEKLCAALQHSCLLSATAGQHLRGHLPLQEAGWHPLPDFDGKHAFYTL